MTDRPATLFVYGTLMPDHLRWPMLSPHVVDTRPATALGWLYDTGQGWPAARLVGKDDGDDDRVDGDLDDGDRDDGDPVDDGEGDDDGVGDGGVEGDGPAGEVPGWAVDLRPDGLDELFAVLDDMEGVDRGLYDRIVVDLADGGTAWAYSTGIATRTLPRIAAWTDQPEA